MFNQTFQISGQPKLDIKVDCNVRIQPADHPEYLCIRAEGDERALEKLEVLQKADGIIVVRQTGGSSINQLNFSFGNGMNVTQVNGATYINSAHNVYVNGKKVSGSGETFEEYEPINVTIWCPPQAILELDLAGEAVFVSTISLAQATIDGSGGGQVTIADVEDLDVDASGCVNMNVANVSGSLSVDASGSCNLEFRGDYEKVMVDASGASKINTYGTCRGNYVVAASGACRISHRGEIEGRVKRNISGVAKVDVG